MHISNRSLLELNIRLWNRPSIRSCESGNIELWMYRRFSVVDLLAAKPSASPASNLVADWSKWMVEIKTFNFISIIRITWCERRIGAHGGYNTAAAHLQPSSQSQGSCTQEGSCSRLLQTMWTDHRAKRRVFWALWLTSVLTQNVLTKWPGHEFVSLVQPKPVVLILPWSMNTDRGERLCSGNGCYCDLDHTTAWR